MRAFNNAFTLIEIIIALAIIAIFVTLPILAYSNYSRNARDTQRKNDVNKVQAALELYKADEGTYPGQDNWEADVTEGGYMPTIPLDPKNGQLAISDSSITYGYTYDVSSDGQSYQISALLENVSPSNPPVDGEVSYYVVSPEGTKLVNSVPGSSEGPGISPTGGAGLPTIAF